MLVLSRKVGERIRIGDDIELVVLELGRDQVRLGITAPRSVAVHRQEVYAEIAEANRMASGEPPTVAAAAAASFTGLPGRDRTGA
jgi:carbon storage regulator